MIGLSISQFHFTRFGLPRIVDKTFSLIYNISDPATLIGYIPENRIFLMTATTTLLKRLFGKDSNPPQSLLDHITNFLDRCSNSGFCRENFVSNLSLNPLGNKPQSNEIKRLKKEFFEASYRSEYEVINISGVPKSYRVKLRLENHDYEGIPTNESIVISSFLVERIRLADDAIVEPRNILSEIQEACVTKLTPLVSQRATVFIDLNGDDDPVIRRFLDKILTTELSLGEKLRITTQYTMYLKKQDFHLSTMSYFTKGFTLKLMAPQEVYVTFNALSKEPFDSSNTTTPTGITTHVWTTQKILIPNEGGIVWWRIRDGKSTQHSKN